METKEQPFLYGAATSAHQVEGDNIHNDWWDWEKRTAGVERSGKATDHYNRYKEDFAVAKDLGHTAHRLSIEWSRIEPQEGEWNRRAVLHYRDVLGELKRLGMKTFVTLHHFTSPLWIARKGGWANAQTPDVFSRYVKYIVQHIGDLVDFWITVNEPIVYAAKSYWYGQWPPQEKRMRLYLRVVNHLARAHILSYHALHSVLPHSHVGMAKHFITYLPDRHHHIDDRAVASICEWWFNHRWFQLTGATHDFIGINYYFVSHKHVQLFWPRIIDMPWKGATSDMSWPIWPQGLTHALLCMRRYSKPIYVTENGIADAQDVRRADFIRGHIRAVEQAQEQGADVRGYLYWSLLDNYEWADGFGPRFGLVAVDYATMQRTVRPSAYAYKAIIESATRN